MRFILVICCLITFIGNVYAYQITSYRCGNKFIELGMTTNQIISTCGNKWMPSEIRTNVKDYTNPRAISHFVKSLPPTANTYQYWLYRQYGKFDTWIWVKNGKIVKIEETNERGN